MLFVSFLGLLSEPGIQACTFLDEDNTNYKMSESVPKFQVQCVPSLHGSLKDPVLERFLKVADYNMELVSLIAYLALHRILCLSGI